MALIIPRGLRAPFGPIIFPAFGVFVAFSGIVALFSIIGFKISVE
jgi:hypothetical protein